jgi:hypothetical protein
MLVFCLASLLFFLAARCEASIQVVESGNEYASRSNKVIGEQLPLGLQYSARLQHIPGNTHLCLDTTHPETQNWNITVPEDGLPGTYDYKYIVWTMYMTGRKQKKVIARSLL